MYCAYRRATFSIFPFNFRFWIRVGGPHLRSSCYNNTMLFRSYFIQILLIENGQSYRNPGSLFNREFKRYFRCSTSLSCRPIFLLSSLFNRTWDGSLPVIDHCMIKCYHFLLWQSNIYCFMER